MEQVPLRTVTASTTRRVPAHDERPGRAGWVVDGITYRFVRIPERHMFGIVDVWVDGETRAPLFDRERQETPLFVASLLSGLKSQRDRVDAVALPGRLAWAVVEDVPKM